MSRIPVKPFQPLPPLVRMERMRDAPMVHSVTSPNNSNSKDTEPWMIDSPTNRSVALLVTNSSGISHDTTLHATTVTSPNDNSNDLWNPLMMMMDEAEDHDGVDHIDDEVGPSDSYYPRSPHAASATAKRVSLDVVSDACAMIMMDVDSHHHQHHHHHHESLLQQYPHQDLPMMTSSDNHDHEFELMEGLEHDPLLTLSVACDENDIVGTTVSSNTAMSNSLNIPEAVPQRLPSLRRLFSETDYDADHDGMNDPWTNAANEAAFQMTEATTAFADDHNDLMVFEIDQSFLKANGHTTTVGTESTVSSYSSVSPDLLSVFTGDNNHHHRNSISTTNSTVPTFFTSQQFQERCQLLSESMRASQLSRQCLSLQENIKLRANLAKVLKDIERSTAKVQRHCLSQQIQPHPSQEQQQPVVGSTTLFDTTLDNDTMGNAENKEINNDLLAKFENDVVNNDHDTSHSRSAIEMNSTTTAAITLDVFDHPTHCIADTTPCSSN